MTIRVNREWRLIARPVGRIKVLDFAWKEEPVPFPREGQFLVRNLYLSLEPGYRVWAGGNRGIDLDLPPIQLGEVMGGFAIGTVEQSRNPKFAVGTYVQGLLGWQDYGVTDGTFVVALPNDPLIPLTAYFGLLGYTGNTAYFGLLDVGRPKAGETLVVSAAASAVGSLVGQIGKIKGCQVVGIAGSDEKCHWIKDELGYDAAINYKTESVLEGLKKHCPNGIDLYFDNVGGEILDAVLGLINKKARIVACGMISTYNRIDSVPGLLNLENLIFKRARMEGFAAIDYQHRAQEAASELLKWHSEGKLKYKVDVVEGLEKAPKVINKLYDGSNQGKLIVKI